MIGSRRRVLGVLAAVKEARQRHPELRVPLTWRRLQQVYDREGILLKRLRIDANADVLGFDGIFVVTINTDAPVKRHARYGAHEYGHIRMHLNRSGEIEKNLSPCQRGDPREFEAELFAALLIIGPKATQKTPAIARLIRAIEEGPQIVEASLAPVPTPAEIRIRPPELPTTRRPSGRIRPRHPAASIMPAPPWRGCSHDDLLVRDMKDGQGLELFTGNGWIQVYDIRFRANEIGRPRRRRTKTGDRFTEVRYFILGTDDRRMYVFKSDIESRRPIASLLLQQLAVARQVDPPASETVERSRVESQRGIDI